MASEKEERLEGSKKESNPSERIPEGGFFCIHCGAMNPKTATYCVKCGKMPYYDPEV